MFAQCDRGEMTALSDTLVLSFASAVGHDHFTGMCKGQRWE